MEKGKTSIIIPSRNERFLPQTVADIFAHAKGDIEVIVTLDGYWHNPPLPDNPNLIFIHRGQARGMRDAINSAAAIAKGEFLMKCDAHCSFAEGFDETLKKDCEDNWIVIPRRFSLDAERWMPHKEPIDYEHIFYPYNHPEEMGLHARPWMERSRERKHIPIDENMSFQGSCWFMTAKHFNEHLHGFSEYGYGSFRCEAQEIGFKTQLGPWQGQVMSNKNTWYAHLHKGKLYGRMYTLDWQKEKEGTAYTFDYWWNNKWEERSRDIEWLFDHFMPIPAWPDNWKEMKNAH